MSAHVTVISTSPVYIATSTGKPEEISHVSQLHPSTDILVVKKNTSTTPLSILIMTWYCCALLSFFFWWTSVAMTLNFLKTVTMDFSNSYLSSRE